MDLKSLSSYSEMVDREISRYLDREVDELYEPLRDLFARGGKRIRPFLCMVSCEAVGGKKEDALKAAAAIEMVHNFTLIHDDIADRSELRRGQPCLHHKYGLGVAINAADGLFSTAYEVLGDTLADGDGRVFKTLSGGITEVCEGQAMDISWVQNRRWDLSEEDYFEMIRRKTGALMSASCETGAIIGGGTERQIRALSDFGMDMGVGFQIHDDVLNLRGDVKRYGKEICGDINEGKRTLVVIYTLSVCTPKEKKRLIKILDRERNSQEEINNALGIINRYGSVDRATDIAKNLVEKGKKGLKALPDSRARETLRDAADYMIERKL